MKYAIDRYGVGLEKEVSADIFYNKYIPQKKDRFFCPECGERVFWFSSNRWTITFRSCKAEDEGLHFRFRAPKDNLGRCCPFCGR